MENVEGGINGCGVCAGGCEGADAGCGVCCGDCKKGAQDFSKSDTIAP